VGEKRNDEAGLDLPFRVSADPAVRLVGLLLSHGTNHR